MEPVKRPIAPSQVLLKEVKSEPNKILIEELEDLLEDARKGDVVGIYYVAAFKGGFVSNGWAHRYMNIERSILGELSFLNFELIENFLKKDRNV